MPERPLGPADWLKKTVTDFDKQNAPKVEEVKQVVEEVKRLDPAAPPTKVEEIKVEEKVVPVPLKVEEPKLDTVPASTVPPAVASPAPVVTPAPVTTPVSAQPPISPLK
jgi:hypothetical protein